jgi:hypothetical protein
VRKAVVRKAVRRRRRAKKAEPTDMPMMPM